MDFFLSYILSPSPAVPPTWMRPVSLADVSGGVSLLLE